MPAQPRPSLLHRLLGRPVDPPELDAADMGTAFGLEYTLQTRPPVAPQPPLTDTPPPQIWQAWC